MISAFGDDTGRPGMRQIGLGSLVAVVRRMVLDLDLYERPRAPESPGTSSS